LAGGKDFVGKVRERIFYLMRFSILSQCKRAFGEQGFIWDLGALTTARGREFWMCWRRFSWELFRI